MAEVRPEGLEAFVVITVDEEISEDNPVEDFNQEEDINQEDNSNQVEDIKAEEDFTAEEDMKEHKTPEFETLSRKYFKPNHFNREYTFSNHKPLLHQDMFHKFYHKPRTKTNTKDCKEFSVPSRKTTKSFWAGQKDQRASCKERTR